MYPRCLVVLCGFSGHGFKMALAMGQVASDLALDGGTDLPIEHPAPARFVTKGFGAGAVFTAWLAQQSGVIYTTD